MNLAEVALTLTHATTVRPVATQSLDEWRELVAASYASAEAAPSRALCELLFAEIGQDAKRSIRMDGAAAHVRFRAAGGESQRELANQALTQLIGQLAEGEAGQRCELLVYASASMDERIHQAPAGWLASLHGLSRQPHFALSQLQGASLAAGVDIIAAMLSPENGAGLFVAAEKWPLPFSRVAHAPAALGDAAVALWFVRGEAPGLRLVGNCQQGYPPFLMRNPDGQAEPCMDREPLLEAAQRTIAEALLRHNLRAEQIDGWLPSGLDAPFEEELRRRCGISAPYVAQARPDDGYFCSAAMPALCADVLQRIAAGELADGALLLSWGVSLGGGIGVVLWCVVAHPNKELT